MTSEVDPDCETAGAASQGVALPGFDVCSDRGERDGWSDEPTVHLINIKSFVGCGACG
jgi:hypothetical protein